MGAPEGGGARGAGGAGARGALLLAVALVLGVVLLQKFDETDGASSVSAGGGVTLPSVTVTPTTRRPSVSVVPQTTVKPARPPDQVKVLVANGTGTAGLAGGTTSLLQGASYNVLSPVDATKLTDITLVEYRPDFEAEARVIAQLLLLPGSALRPMEDTPPVNDTRGADVLVIAGPDLKLPGTTTTVKR